MSYQTQRDEAAVFAQRIKALGFKVYLAESGTHGFITDETESRVLNFGFGGVENTLGGNYWPHSTTSGTGWRMDRTTDSLKTADDVRSALYAHPHFTTGGGWKTFTTVKQHLSVYGASSKYVEV